MTEVQHVANALLKAWFPKSHGDQSWLTSEDGKNWYDIAMLDAAVAIDAYLDWQSKYGDDLK
jgi:hypothetical protein